MRDWVEEFASLCDANSTDKKGCSEQQIKFIDKWSGKLICSIYLDIYRQMGLAEPCLHLGIYFFAMPGSQKMISRVSWPVSRDPGLQEGILEWRCDWNKKSNQPISQPTHKPSNAPTNQRTDQSIYQCLIWSYLIWSYLIVSYLMLSYLILSYLILSDLILSYLILSYLILSYLSTYPSTIQPR